VQNWRRAAVMVSHDAHARQCAAVTYDARDVIPLLPTEHGAIAADCRASNAKPKKRVGIVDVPSRVLHDGPYLGGGGGGLGVPVVS
jgi:hypothetical protein